MFPEAIQPIVLALFTAVAAGLIGSFALMRRMVLAGDVMSHIALPGIGLALLYGINPLIGGGATLAIGSVLIWQLEKRTGLTTESMLGVIFAASLALGALLASGDELIDALFGNFGKLSLTGFLLGLLGSLVVLLFVWKCKDQLLLTLFSPDLAFATGVHIARLNLYFLLSFSLTILLGFRFLGALLVGALIIIPAAAGRQLTHTLPRFLLASSIISALSVLLGIWIVSWYRLAPTDLGPIVVLLSAVFFALSLFKPKR